MTRYRLTGPNAASIAHHLAAMAGISPGGELAPVLDPGGPACNRSALRAWVRRQLADIANRPIAGNLLVAIEQRLAETLAAVAPDAGGEIDLPTRQARASSLPHPRWEPVGHCTHRGSQPLRAPTGGFSAHCCPYDQKHLQRPQEGAHED